MVFLALLLVLVACCFEVSNSWLVLPQSASKLPCVVLNGQRKGASESSSFADALQVN